MAQWQGRAQTPQRSGAILQLFTILFLRGFAGFDEALSAAIQPHSDGGAGVAIPNPKTAGIGGRPSLLTPVGLRPPSVNKLVSSTITLLLFQSHIIDKRTFVQNNGIILHGALFIKDKFNIHWYNNLVDDLTPTAREVVVKGSDLKRSLFERLFEAANQKEEK